MKKQKEHPRAGVAMAPGRGFKSISTWPRLHHSPAIPNNYTVPSYLAPSATTVGTPLRHISDEDWARGPGRLTCEICQKRLNDKDYEGNIPMPMAICTKCLIEYLLRRFNNSTKDIQAEVSKIYKEMIADELQRGEAKYEEIK